MATRFMRSRLRQLGQQQRQLDVALGGEHRQQVVELEDEADVLRAPARQLAARQRADVRAADFDPPPVGWSSPPIRLSSVVLPEPDGPISARKSPCGMSSVTPFSTSMRSLPRVKYLWTPLILTSALIAPCRDLTCLPTIPAAARSTTRSPPLSPASDFEPIAVGAADLDGAALDASSRTTNTNVVAVFSSRPRACGTSVTGCAAARGRGRRRLAQERHLHAHVRQDARIELLEADAHEHRRLLAIGGRHHRDDVGRNLPVGIGIEHGRDRLPGLTRLM